MTLDVRHLARGLALQALYEIDTTHHSPKSVIEAYSQITPSSDNARVVAYLVLRSCFDESMPLYEDDENVSFDSVAPTPSAPMCQMMEHLVLGVVEYRTQLDELITRYAPEWPLDQIAIVDRNILRIAIYELMFGQRLPVRIVINEAIEIAKLFGGDSSSRFINGVLGAIVEYRDQMEQSEEPPSVTDSTTELPLDSQSISL